MKTLHTLHKISVFVYRKCLIHLLTWSLHSQVTKKCTENVICSRFKCFQSKHTLLPLRVAKFSSQRANFLFVPQHGTVINHFHNEKQILWLKNCSNGASQSYTPFARSCQVTFNTKPDWKLTRVSLFYHQVLNFILPKGTLAGMWCILHKSLL